MTDDLTRLSKFLSYVLRHRPETIDLTIDPQGWAPLSVILANTKTPITLDQIRDICRTDAKGRYVLDELGGRIRAVQGHSVDVDLDLEKVRPPAQLFHGTARRLLHLIRGQGLKPMNRHHVHLSADRATAIDVGRRHDRRERPVVFIVRAAEMAADGYQFYRAENGVYLAETVPAKYLIADDRID